MQLRFFYRVKRQKAATVAAVLLALMIVASSGISAQSRATIGSTIANNGRGAYDLLVTAGTQLAGAAGRDGLIEQNFAAFAGTAGITADQLSAIRAMDDVAVAAPLSFVGDLQTPAYGVLVGARDPDGAVAGFFTEDPQAFDVQVEITTTDGVQTQTLSSTGFSIAVARTGSGQSASAIMATSGIGSANTFNLSADVTIPGVPELSSGLVAVDPVAEQRLLGRSGAFLAPLVQFDRQARAGAGNNALAELVPEKYAIERAALQSAPSDAATVPVVVSDSAYAPLIADVSVTPISTAGFSASEFFASVAGGLTSLSPAGQRVVADAARGPTRTMRYDLTHQVVPFAEPFFSIPLPGAANGPDGAANLSTPILVPRSVSPAPYGPAPRTAEPAPDGVAANLTARDQGFVAVTPTAKEQTYRPPSRVLPGTTGPFLYAPLGTYSPGDVTDTGNDVSYVPLGTYSAGTATVTQPGPRNGLKLGPSFSGRGLELSAPGAITTLSALSTFRPNAGVDVVRVRVAGGRTYTPAAMTRIEDVASRIADLGLQVRVVAGSSLEPVGIYVPNFFARPQGATGLDLGWIEQEWTSLGAAVKVERASLGGTAWLLAISLFAAVALAGAVQAVALSGRRKETAFLIQLGWRRRRVFAWFVAEGSIGYVLVALGVAVAATFNAGSPLALSASAAGASLWLALMLGAAWLASRSGPLIAPPSRARRQPKVARSPSAVGSHASRAHPVAAGMTALALLVLGATTVAFSAVVSRAKIAAGGSRLAELVSQQLLLPQTLLAAMSWLASGVLFALGAALLRQTITPQVLMLAASGWSRGELAALMRATVARPALAAVVVGTGLCAGLAVLLDPRHWSAHALLALAVMLLVSAAALFTVSRDAHRLAAMTRAQRSPEQGRNTSRQEAMP